MAYHIANDRNARPLLLSCRRSSACLVFGCHRLSPTRSSASHSLRPTSANARFLLACHCLSWYLGTGRTRGRGGRAISHGGGVRRRIQGGSACPSVVKATAGFGPVEPSNRAGTSHRTSGRCGGLPGTLKRQRPTRESRCEEVALEHQCAIPPPEAECEVLAGEYNLIEQESDLSEACEFFKAQTSGCPASCVHVPPAAPAAEGALPNHELSCGIPS